MIQIAVCDDEKYYRDKIRELAAQFLEKRQLPYTVTVYPSGEDFLAGEENLVKYDIVFLDISMKDIDGIETAMRIDLNRYHRRILLLQLFYTFRQLTLQSTSHRYQSEATAHEG